MSLTTRAQNSGLTGLVDNVGLMSGACHIDASLTTDGQLNGLLEVAKDRGMMT